ncbi:TetR/AcrR family transcriptional regulator [Microbispora sp. CA-135349]|uniref:TetR/AcrR family transcriptional regulator n=1 Tax=Microbispora sp. CA-135349 TaxID=3239953 RepID=UPI003D932526
MTAPCSLPAAPAVRLDLPVHEIARRAGLGVATVYRHFPSRQDLVGAVLSEQVAVCRAQMRAALDDPGPWRALRGTVHRFAEHQVRHRGLNEALLGSLRAGSPENAAVAVRRLADLLVAGMSRPHP